MAFRDDDRGVSAVVGATLLFGFLVVFLAVYQASVVPDQNEQVEFDHSQDVQRDLVEVRNAVLSAGEAGTDGFVSVTLGTTYPSRVVAINPPPVTGTLRTTANRSFAVRNGTGAPVTGEVCPGEAVTRSLVYDASYHAYDEGPSVVYENSVAYERYPTGNVTLTDQALVEGDTVSLTPLRGAYDRSGLDTASFEAKAGRVASATVEDPEIELPTRLDEETWVDLLSGQVAPGNVSVADGNVTVELDGEYTVDCAPVGAGAVPPSGGRSDDGGDPDINPAEPGAVLLEDSSTAGNAVVEATFNNTGDAPTNATEARVSFYFNRQGSKQPTNVTVREQSGPQSAALTVGGPAKPLDPKIQFPPDGTTTLAFAFDENVKSGDFFVVEIRFSNGETATYFVAPS